MYALSTVFDHKMVLKTRCKKCAKVEGVLGLRSVRHLD